MKAVILAGGLGTRISEETHLKPKPMIEIGGKPILWHIMKIYSHFGIHDFIICSGYKGYIIKEYFANYFLHQSDVTFNMRDNTMRVHVNNAEPWSVTIVDTKESSMTGGRLKLVKDYIGDETFLFTYGDGVANINISSLLEFHKKQGLLATVTAVKLPGRFGLLEMSEHQVSRFLEKPDGVDGSWINGGFFVLEPKVIDYIKDDTTMWEKEPMERLATDCQLAAYRHNGFWQCMDTLRDKNKLEELWGTKQAPWKVW